MAKKKKYYTVWSGVEPGVYSDWKTCKIQIDGYEGAIYKSFGSKEEATSAFNDTPWKYVGAKVKDKTNKAKTLSIENNPAIVKNSMSVDAACSGNPGDMEYRGVYIETGEEVFRQGPYEQGTNNIGEFLAIVHALALLKQKGTAIPIYTDSATAMAWVRDKKCKTKLEQIPENKTLFYMIERAEKWLKENIYRTQIIKWNTKKWGEIPADFGRK